MNNFAEDFIETEFAATQDAQPNLSDALVRITKLAQLLQEQKNAVLSLTDQLAAAKLDARRTEEEDLPELMREIGLTEIKLEDGSSVKVIDEVDCAITEANRFAAHTWLIAHDFGGIIKTAITIEFDRNEQEVAADAAQKIQELLNREALVSEKIHPQTLKSFVKEQLQKGTPIPQELFGLRPYAKAKLTLNK